MNKSPKLVCKNVWKLYGDNPKEFLQSHNNNPNKEIIKTNTDRKYLLISFWSTLESIK